MVSSASNVHDAGDPTMSETMGSRCTPTPGPAALWPRGGERCVDVGDGRARGTTAVKSVIDPPRGTRSGAVEASLHGRQHQLGGPGRPGGDGDDVGAPPGPAAGRHAAGRAGSDRWYSRGRSASVRWSGRTPRPPPGPWGRSSSWCTRRWNDHVGGRLEVVIVHPDHESGVGVLRRSRDDDPLGRAAEMAGGVVRAVKRPVASITTSTPTTPRAAPSAPARRRPGSGSPTRGIALDPDLAVKRPWVES